MGRKVVHRNRRKGQSHGKAVRNKPIKSLLLNEVKNMDSIKHNIPSIEGFTAGLKRGSTNELDRVAEFTEILLSNLGSENKEKIYDTLYNDGFDDDVIGPDEADWSSLEEEFLYDFGNDIVLKGFFMVIGAFFNTIGAEKASEYIHDSGLVDVIERLTTVREAAFKMFVAAMFGGYKKGDEYARQMLVSTYKYLYKKEYKEIKKYHEIKFHDVTQFHRDSFGMDVRTVIMARALGISLAPSIAGYIAIKTAEWGDEMESIDEAQSTTAFLWDEMYGKEREKPETDHDRRPIGDREQWISMMNLLFDLCAMEDGCQRESLRDRYCDYQEEAVRKVHSHFVWLYGEDYEERMGLSDDELTFWSILLYEITEKNKDQITLAGMTGGLMGDSNLLLSKFNIDDSGLPFELPDPKLFGKETRYPLHPVSDKADREAEVEEQRNLEEELKNAKEELEELRRRYKEKSSEVASCHKELTQIKDENNTLNSEMEGYKRERQELIALRDFVYQNSLEEEGRDDETSEEMYIKELSKYKAVVVGGGEGNRTRLKEILPDWSFYDPDKCSTSINMSAVAGRDKVFFFTKCLTHKTYYKFLGFAQKADVPVGYLNNFNIRQCLGQMYRELCL